MNEKLFYKLSLGLPIIVPAICYLVTPDIPLEASDPVYDVSFALILSGLIGGIPYLIFLIAFLIWMRKREVGQIRTALLVTPLIFIPIFILICSILIKTVVNKSPPDTELFRYIPYFPPVAGCILLFGYSYVFVTFGLARILRRRPFGAVE